MSKPGIIYRMAFTNVEDNQVQCDIFDKSVLIDDGADETVTPIEGAEDCLHIACQDNDENKFTPIKALKCVIKFLNSTTVNLRTFASGEDDRFKVIVTINSIVIFDGFLEQGDVTEPFQYESNQIVELTAIDGLAFLKDIRLTDDDGKNPVNENTMIQYIAWCLHKIGSTKNINVINNLREQDNPGMWQITGAFSSGGSFTPDDITQAIFFKVGNTLTVSGSASNDGTYTIDTVDLSTGEVDLSGGSLSDEGSGATITFTDTSAYGNIYKLFLDAKTFEDGIGQSEYCYSVLQKILGHDCFITQALGEWWIVRVREFRNDFTTYTTVFDNTGAAVSFTSGNNKEKSIGLKPPDGTPFSQNPDAGAFFSLARTNWLLQRPNKYVKLTYNYRYPLEILCNKNFDRGDFITDAADESTDIFGDALENGATYQAKLYGIECWEYDRNVPPDSQDSAAYIKRLFLFGYEKERFIFMPATVSNDFYYLRSLDKVPVGKRDKLNFSADFRYSTDWGGSGDFTFNVAWIRLYGDDGTFWNVHMDNGGNQLWKQSDVDWATNQSFVQWIGNVGDTDPRNWITVGGDIPPFPVGGKLEISLLNTDNANSQDKHFSNIRFDLTQFINGSYQPYSGQSNTTTKSGNYKPSIEDEVFISNSPSRLFKGAILKRALVQDAFDYILVDLFYEGQEYLYPVGDGLLHLKSYGELQVRAYHNQFRNSDETYQAVCQGLSAPGDDLAQYYDLIHRVYNRDLEPSTNNKVFQQVTGDIDLRNCEWTATLIKNFDNDIGFINDDDFLFRYESQSSN